MTFVAKQEERTINFNEFTFSVRVTSAFTSSEHRNKVNCDPYVCVCMCARACLKTVNKYFLLRSRNENFLYRIKIVFIRIFNILLFLKTLLKLLITLLWRYSEILYFVHVLYDYLLKLHCLIKFSCTKVRSMKGLLSISWSITSNVYISCKFHK